nr:MAG TPA: hypothetical protein [Siphoviridae sp. cthRu26]
MSATRIVNASTALNIHAVFAVCAHVGSPFAVVCYCMSNAVA